MAHVDPQAEAGVARAAEAEEAGVEEAVVVAEEENRWREEEGEGGSAAQRWRRILNQMRVTETDSQDKPLQTESKLQSRIIERILIPKSEESWSTGKKKQFKLLLKMRWKTRVPLCQTLVIPDGE